MTIRGSEKLKGESAAVARSWYVAPLPRIPRGWLVYTFDFVLATLQGCVSDPQRVRRTWWWLVIGAIVRIAMAIAQVVIMLLAWIPIVSSLLETLARTFTRNVLGFFLRACYWKARLKYLGQDTIIDQYVDIWGAGSVAIGSRCHIDTNVRLAAGEQRHGQHGFIRIGNFVHLGPGVHVAGRGGVAIGNCVGIMANAHLYSATGVIQRPEDSGQLISMSHVAPADQQRIVEGPLVIEDYALVGMMSRIMPGVRVGRGAIVHANSELVRDVLPFANIGAIPRGRQIGWREPLRPSPRLQSISAAPDVIEIPTEAPMGPRIREVLDPNDWQAIEGVLDLHFQAFGEGVTTQLGRSFVYEYYTAIIMEPHCFLWVAEQDGRIIGFLGGTIDRHDFERANRSGATRLRAAWRFCTFRLSLFAVLRALRKQRLARDFSDHAELLAIVVDPRARRAGLGKRFLDIWTNRIRAAALESFIVFTDNPEGLKYYKKYGGDSLFTFKLRKLSSACFRFDVTRPDGARAMRSELKAPV